MVASAAAHGAAVVHLVRRGITAAQEQFAGVQTEEYMAQLRQDMEADKGVQFSPEELLPMFITFCITMLILISISYTVGDVMGTLAMIESPASVAIVEPKAPAYTPFADEPDAPLEKEPLELEAADVEVTVVHTKMITSGLSSTMAQLQRVGGFFSRWRGLPYAIGYAVAHSALHTILTTLTFAGMTLASHVFWFVLVSVVLARLHMLWTHSMIAKPMGSRSSPRMVARKDAKVLVTPTVIHALAQQALIWVPVLVGLGLGLNDLNPSELARAAKDGDCDQLYWVMARFGLVGVAAVSMLLFVVLPSAATLARIEAALLHEDMQTVVPFDRDTVLGDFDMATAKGRWNIFKQTWRSFDWAARWRVVKLYVQMYLCQISVFVIGFYLMAVELQYIGGERTTKVLKSAWAELQLAAIQSQQSTAQ